MPFARISHTAGKPQSFSDALSKGIHRAMIEAFGVPEDDLFQIVTEHAAKTELIGPGSFLGVDHTEDMVFVQITCAEGRTTDQKKALYASIVHHIARDTDVRQEDVFINLVESKRENFSFGNGLAQFA